MSYSHNVRRARGNLMNSIPMAKAPEQRRWLAAFSAMLLIPGAALAQAPAASSPASSAPTSDPREIIRRAGENDFANDQKARDYTYVERNFEQRLDKHGRVESTKITTREFMILYDEPVERLIARDDKPLSPDEARKEQERIDKWAEKHKNESPEEKQKRLAAEEKDREDDRAFVKEVADAYNFQMLPDEKLGGRDAFVIDAEPRAEFQPRSKEGKYLSKFRFRIWVDKADYDWVKLDAQVIDTVSWGLFLLRLHQGSRIVMEQTRVNDEVWLPLHIQLKVDARLGLIKGFSANADVTFKDYQKFRSEVHILPQPPAHE
jgi:hypothetical protein